MSEVIFKKGKRKGSSGANPVISEIQDQELSPGQKLSSAALDLSTASEPSDTSNSSQNCARGNPTSGFGEEGDGRPERSKSRWGI